MSQTLDAELGCFGLLGFGSGWEWGHANIKPDEKINGQDGYCAKTCPQRARCTLAHQNKCRIMFPRASKAFDELMKDHGQQRAALMWSEQHPETSLEPYAVQMVANIEDGLAVAQTGAPKNRGRLTLRWPVKA